jgi:uncharacterized repeat protein (TIGR02543 family)
MNGVTFAPGKVGQAFSFNGSGQYLVAPDSATLDISDRFTLQSWINPASVPEGAGAAVISKVGGGGGNNGYQLGITSSFAPFCQFNASGEGWPANSLTAGTVAQNAWTHIACTYDNDTLKIYVNGLLAGSKVVGAKSVINSSSTLRISGDDNNHVFFNGLIDEPQIYNRALSDAEVLSVYSAGTAGVCIPTPPSYTVAFTTSSNGTLSGTSSQTVISGGSTTAVTAVPNPGYHFVNWTGDNGFVTTTANPLTVANVTASQTITADFALDVTYGVCGSSSGGVFGSAPTTNLCASGTSGAVTGSGPWNWTCTASDGNTYVTCSTDLQSSLLPGTIITVAGTGAAAFSNDGGAAVLAQINAPYSVALDAAGNLYIADNGNNRVRKVAAGTGVISTFAGTGTPGFSGDGDLATRAAFNNIGGITFDNAGNMFIADYGNNRVRKVAAGTGIVTTVAGSGSAVFAGDGGPANLAGLNPNGIAVDSAGNIYIADYGNNRIRKVANDTGYISTVAGNGTAGFSGDGDQATSASINHPTFVAFDSLGNLHIADAENNRIRMVAKDTGIITTIAGNGIAGFSGDGGPAVSAGINTALSVSFDGSGNMYISDFGSYRIR